MKSDNQKFFYQLLMGTIFLSSLFIILGSSFPKTTTERTSSSSTPITNREKQVAAAPVSLGLSPLSLTARADDKFEIEITIKALNDKIAAVDLWLVYDPEVLAVTEIKPGTFFSAPQVLGEKINSSLGKIAYGIGSFEPTSGEGTIAVISFKTLVPPTEVRETEVSLTKDTLVAALGRGKVEAEFSQSGRYLISK